MTMENLTDHVQQSFITPFGDPVSLRRSGRRKLWNNSATLKMIAKFVTQIFTSTIRPQGLYFLPMLILYFTLKLLELFKSFRLMPHQVDITISSEIISKSNEVVISSSGCRAHWSTYISMYEFQQVCRSLG